jgi:hypothetical protein
VKDLAFRSTPIVSALPAASAALTGVIVSLSTDGHPYWCDGTTWTDLTLLGADARLTTARLTADVTSNTTTVANVTGLAIALDANSTYSIEAKVMFQTASTTTGIRLTQAIPTGATVVAQWNTPTSLTARTLANQRAANTGAATTAIDAANSNSLATGSLLVITAATAGTLQVRFASSSTTNAVVKAGSNLVALKIA